MKYVPFNAVHEIFTANGGLATTRQLLAVLSPKALEVAVRGGKLIRVRRGVYALTPPDVLARLAALDLACGTRIVACMQTAAAMYGFCTEPDDRLHILDIVHVAGYVWRAKLIQGRLATAPAWTAVELARTLRRPRALAVLDAALRTECCSPGELEAAVGEQKGRRGIVHVRDLLQRADGRAESPMESEARLAKLNRRSRES